MTPSIGSVVANRFQLVRELGRGSMGSVWLADHLTLEVRCAVKFMSADAMKDPAFRSRFEFEARAIAQLQSPHIVRVLDYAVDDDMPFIAMEYLQGEDLCARLSRVGRLDPVATYRIAAQIARGLTKAHLAGLVHRDLKPENIFLAQEDEDENAKLLDFGVAKSTAFVVNNTATQAGSLLGTPAYMSPEQARGVREIDHRADLWSLAVIVYQCLTGKLPFDSQTLGDLFAQIMYEPMPVPSHVAPWLPVAFDQWWSRAASRNVEERFASARDLSDALAKALNLSPSLSPHVSETWPGQLASVQVPAEAVLLARMPLDSDIADLGGEHLTNTGAPLTLSLRGAARDLIASKRGRYGAAALATLGLMVTMLVFNTQTKPGPAHAASPALAEADRVPPPTEASGAVAAVPVRDESDAGPVVEGHPQRPTSSPQAGGLRSDVVSVEQLPKAARVAPAAPRAAPRKGPHGNSKDAPDEVDFGI